MNLHDLTPNEGSRRTKRRVGRGHGSGRVKTSGRGTKGQNSRSGGGTKLHFSGGQNPWTMKVPHKRGFNIGRFRKSVQVLNIRDLEGAFESGATLTLSSLRDQGLIDDISGKDPVKLLGMGRLSKKLTLEVHYASRTAVAAVEAAGGTLTLLRAPIERPVKQSMPAMPGSEGAESDGESVPASDGADTPKE